MARLIPTETFVVPVHPSTKGTKVHRLAVDKYVFAAPQQPAERSVAYMWAHPTGFSKEMMHPLMRRCLTELRALQQYQKTDITFVAFDARNQGDSALLNEADIDVPDYGWIHHGLDTVQVIKKLKLKKNHNKLIGVGHSFGGCGMLVAEFLFPKTFDGLCLVEAVVTKDVLPYDFWDNLPIMKETLKRRDTWPSRDECAKSLRERPFWRDLHPEVFQNYVDYALYDTPDGNVKLKCRREHEHRVYFAAHHGAIIAYNGLKTLTTPLHMVHAEQSLMMDPATAPEIKALSSWITSSVVPGSHMVPAETPEIIVPEVMYLTERVMTERARL